MAQRDARDSRFAVVVLGAGPGGAAAAAELARRGLRSALVGRRVDPRPNDPRPNDPRPNVGECLPPGIRPQLEKAGVWESFLRAGHTPSAGIRSIWGGPEAADRDFIFSPYGAGWHIDRARFDAMMRNSAISCGAEWIDCQALRDVSQTPSGWRIDLTTDDGERSLQGSVVIDATGRASAFARRIGVKRRMLDRLTGVAGYYSLDESALPIDPVLLVEAVEDGWWYSAPLPGGRLIAVFLTDADYVQSERLTQTDRWTSRLQATVQQRRRIQTYGGKLDGAVRILSAESSFLERISGDGWLATGDAAAAFDPLSSQGIVSAISSGLDAAQTTAAWIEGDDQAPAQYAQRTRGKYAEYLAHRQIYYGIERRWPASRFWRTRHAAPEALSARVFPTREPERVAL